ncbi:MFS transporter [Alterisphingorhabdus coralli]|uniref:MFS transporter n=1 Tax=Alterisphingorhabdus coralli TaxID=3071408 RepID=A0AA97I2C6_9SPHN|nr:MFS transporter [Parasphingorhabdus sp. SCSIO 66989]WOE76245.1 MFS transporter [Parasphingorhabdus sp. SCSIO 66989]
MAQPYIPPCQESRIEAEDCPRAAGREPTVRIQRLTLAACILASSMAFIDGSALTVALPQLTRDLGGNIGAVQWVLNGYVLALAAFTMIGGALADAYGRARMLTWGCIGFALASLGCALAPGAEMLIAARVLQGLAAAIMTPSSLALIGETFAKDERARAIGIWAGASALTTASGPVLGGWLTETFSWRAVFWINLPLAAVAVALLAIVRRPGITDPKPFDIVGAVLLALALTGIAYGFSVLAPEEGASTQASGLDLSWPVFAGLGAGSALLGIFLMWEQRIPAPMIPGKIFRSISFSGLNLSTLLIYAGLSISFFLLPFRLIDELGLSATRAGMVFLPFTLLVGLLSGYFGGLADRMGIKPMLIIGPLLAAIGFALFAINSGFGLVIGVILPMAVAGLGFAIIVAPLTSGIMNSVDDQDEGLASGINNTSSRIAQMIGVALAAAFATMATGYAVGMWMAAILCVAGALVIMATLSGGRQAPLEPSAQT